MRKFVSQIASAAAVAACASVPVHAMSMPAVQDIASAEAPGSVQQVDWHGGWGGGGWNRGCGGYHGCGGYYGGYHHNNNYWVPLAAFGAGALVGALAAQPHYYSQPYYYHRTYYHQSGHYAWCAGRYHPYRCYVTRY
jgi:hypothetical protein